MFLNTTKEDKNKYLVELAEQLGAEDASVNTNIDYFEIIYNENGEYAFSEKGIVFNECLEKVLAKLGYGVLGIDVHEMGANATIMGNNKVIYELKAFQIFDSRYFSYPPEVIIDFNSARLME